MTVIKRVRQFKTCPVGTPYSLRHCNVAEPHHGQFFTLAILSGQEEAVFPYYKQFVALKFLIRQQNPGR